MFTSVIRKPGTQSFVFFGKKRQDLKFAAWVLDQAAQVILEKRKVKNTWDSTIKGWKILLNS